MSPSILSVPHDPLHGPASTEPDTVREFAAHLLQLFDQAAPYGVAAEENPRAGILGAGIGYAIARETLRTYLRSTEFPRIAGAREVLDAACNRATNRAAHSHEFDNAETYARRTRIQHELLDVCRRFGECFSRR